MPDPHVDVIEDLQTHITDQYGVTIDAVLNWAPDVFVLRRRDSPSWVARVFPPTRSLAAVQGDAAVLNWLAELGYPAERTAAPSSVTVLNGRPVLVTDWVQGVPRAQRRPAIKNAGGIAGLGELLGRLHTLSADGPRGRPGGAWHHMAEGLPSAELAVAHEWLTAAEGEARARDLSHFAELEAALDAVDGCDGLPEAFLHPDFVLANVVATTKPEMVLVDWAGAGRGPRLWPLAFLLWAEGATDLRRVDLALRGYRRHVQLIPEELERLPAAISARPLVFDIWRLRHANLTGAAAAKNVLETRVLAEQIADRAIAALS